ncbi:MAG: tetratricopeptide repeat protein, partial [Pyrinomonadaceae bacterium]|nr:tetratricopeptide repeat protein [Pyrinomonadaceae bacterium]
MKRLAIVIALVGISVSAAFSQASDAALRRAIEADTAARLETKGKLPTLAAAEHLSRAETYMANRMFPQAREHWAKVLEAYPDDAGIPKALFGTARSYMWEREYLKAVEWFDKLTKDHLNTKDGREGLAFKGASYVRAGKNLEAAKVYEQYVVMFPEGEKIESAHLNIIDAYREAKEYTKAADWVNRTAMRFKGKPAEANALQARVRMEIHRGRWNDAVSAADDLLTVSGFRGSMTSPEEARFLKGLALERAGRGTEANAIYRSLPHTPTSYFGGLAAEKLAGGRVEKIASVTPVSYTHLRAHETA